MNEEMLVEETVECPYCGETFTTMVDYSAGSQSYVEDCEVCCRPIEFAARVDARGEPLGVTVDRDD